MSEVNSIFKVWGDHEGWVALPRKKRDDNQPKGPKNHDGKWEEKMFQWPQETEKIVDWIKESHRGKFDLYWCPSIFSLPRRVKENIPYLTALYADLDEKHPDTIPVDQRPSMCWETSPGRYAGIWFPDRVLEPQEGELINKDLTYSIGADKGGWDLTQVLRVPGLKNYKYEGAPKGRLLWLHEDHRYHVEKVIVPEPEEPDDLDFDMLEERPLHELIRPHLGKLDTKTLELLFTPEDDVLLSDRSAKLWELECSLLERGLSPEDTLQLVSMSAWNKYKGRRDETRRLVTEINKAVDYIDIKPTPINTKKMLTTYSELMSAEHEQPGWMIEGVWQQGSHGMIAGEPKTYKSVLVTDMAVSVASGEPFLGRFPVHQQGPVIYIQEENAPWLVKDRVMKIAHTRGQLNGKADLINGKLTLEMPPDLPMYFLNNKGFDLTNEEDRDLLEGFMKEIRPVLVIFDPLYLMLGGKDENSSKDIRPILTWLLKMRYDYKTSIIVLHHWNKSGKSERGGQRMLGSVLWHGWVESALYTNVVNEEQHEIAVEREFRSFEKPTKIQVKFEFGAPGELTYKATMSDMTLTTDDSIIDLFETYGSLSLEEVKSYLGIPKSQTISRLAKLVKDNVLINNGDNYKINGGKK